MENQNNLVNPFKKTFIFLFVLTILWTTAFLILSFFRFDTVIYALEVTLSNDGKIEAKKLAWLKALFAPCYILILLLGFYKVTSNLPTSSVKFISIYLIFIFSHYLFYVNQNELLGRPKYEDDAFELATAILAFATAIIFFSAVFLGRHLALLFALAMFLYGMEEISWGQRVFSIESGEFFQKYNQQKELNIHNFFNPFIYYLYAPFFLLLALFLTYFRNIKALKKVYGKQTIKLLLKAGDKYYLVYVLLVYFIMSIFSFDQYEFLEQQFSVFSFAFSIIFIKEIILEDKPY